MPGHVVISITRLVVYSCAAGLNVTTTCVGLPVTGSGFRWASTESCVITTESASICPLFQSVSNCFRSTRLPVFALLNTISSMNTITVKATSHHMLRFDGGAVPAFPPGFSPPAPGPPEGFSGVPSLARRSPRHRPAVPCC
jgi:hypothetical protein